VFGLHNDRHWRREDELGGTPTQEKVDKPNQPARRIDVKEYARKQARLARKVPTHVEEDWHDEEFRTGFFCINRAGQWDAFSQRLLQPGRGDQWVHVRKESGHFAAPEGERLCGTDEGEITVGHGSLRVAIQDSALMLVRPSATGNCSGPGVYLPLNSIHGWGQYDGTAEGTRQPSIHLTRAGKNAGVLPLRARSAL